MTCPCHDRPVINNPVGSGDNSSVLSCPVCPCYPVSTLLAAWTVRMFCVPRPVPYACFDDRTLYPFFTRLRNAWRSQIEAADCPGYIQLYFFPMGLPDVHCCCFITPTGSVVSTEMGIGSEASSDEYHLGPLFLFGFQPSAMLSSPVTAPLNDCRAVARHQKWRSRNLLAYPECPHGRFVFLHSRIFVFLPQNPRRRPPSLPQPGSGPGRPPIPWFKEPLQLNS